MGVFAVFIYDNSCDCYVLESLHETKQGAIWKCEHITELEKPYRILLKIEEIEVCQQEKEHVY